MTRVFVNGCFDLIHVGHVTLLKYARSLGDHLTVAINTDTAVARLKGPGRPIIPEVERLMVVRSLRDVDEAFIFWGNDPVNFLKEMYERGEGPDIVVKGKEYKDKDFPERNLVINSGGTFDFYSIYPSASTTRIIHACQDLSGRGSHRR